MRTSDAFPSNYLKAADLGTSRPTVTIERYEEETIGRGRDAETKYVLYFAGKGKGLMINKTNAKLIEKFLGTDDWDEWIGKKIVLYATTTDFQGDTVDCIRVAKFTGQQPAAPAPEPAPAEPEPGSDFQASDADVPF